MLNLAIAGLFLYFVGKVSAAGHDSKGITQATTESHLKQHILDRFDYDYKEYELENTPVRGLQRGSLVPTVISVPTASRPPTGRTTRPVLSPSLGPAPLRSNRPTLEMSSAPTAELTLEPTLNILPTAIPTVRPSEGASSATDSPIEIEPGQTMSPQPSASNPTSSPITRITRPPVATRPPFNGIPVTRPPTTAPTESPTNSPTMAPTLDLTAMPTAPPTSMPTQNPTSSPTNSPSKSPTPMPTLPPTTLRPTQPPTPSPTDPPTVSPTSPPTLSPSTSPTISPTTAAPVTMSPTVDGPIFGGKSGKAACDDTFFTKSGKNCKAKSGKTTKSLKSEKKGSRDNGLDHALCYEYSLPKGDRSKGKSSKKKKNTASKAEKSDQSTIVAGKSGKGSKAVNKLLGEVNGVSQEESKTPNEAARSYFSLFSLLVFSTASAVLIDYLTF